MSDQTNQAKVPSDVAPPSTLSALTIAAISGLAGAALSLATSYWIVLKQVEQPKIALEEKKTLLEAHRQILSLAPRMETTCDATAWQPAAWLIECSSKNNGTYPTLVQIKKVSVEYRFEPSLTPMTPDNGFKLPSYKAGFMNPAGTSPGVLRFYMFFDHKDYADRTLFNNLQVIVEFSYTPSQHATDELVRAFPDQKDLINEMSSQPGETVPVLLRVPIPQREISNPIDRPN